MVKRFATYLNNYEYNRFNNLSKLLNCSKTYLLYLMIDFVSDSMYSAEFIAYARNRVKIKS